MCSLIYLTKMIIVKNKSEPTSLLYIIESQIKSVLIAGGHVLASQKVVSEGAETFNKFGLF